MTIEVIELWHKRARPNPTEQDFNVQLGCHLEELCEMFSAIKPGTQRTQIAMSAAHFGLLKLADGLKAGLFDVYVEDEEEFLDSIADQVVTAIGAGWCAGMRTREAIEEVNRSNWSKFDANGHPVKDANGKIMKGERYSPPDLKALTRMEVKS